MSCCSRIRAHDMRCRGAARCCWRPTAQAGLMVPSRARCPLPQTPIAAADEEDAVQLAQLLGRCCSISVLDVSHNGLVGGSFANHWCPGFPCIMLLLAMVQCSHPDTAVAHHALQGDGFVAALSASDLLVQSDRLTVVDLSENCFGCDGLEILTRAMESAGG